MIMGKKVRFRPIEEDDLPLVAQWFNDPDIARTVIGWSFPVSLAQQRAWYARSLTDQANQRWIVETHDGQPIGLTGLWEIDLHNRRALTALKIGAKEIQGKGYGSDAFFTVLSYGFYQVGLNRIWGEILPFNPASYRMTVERCGFKVEGILRQQVQRDGVFHDVIRVGILREEFAKLPQARDYLPTPEVPKVVISPEHTAFGPAAAGASVG